MLQRKGEVPEGCSIDKVLVRFAVVKRRYWEWSDCCILSIVFWLDRGHTNRIDVMGHQFCHRMFVTCEPYVAIVSDITTSATKKKHFFHFSFVAMSIKSEILQ